MLSSSREPRGPEHDYQFLQHGFHCFLCDPCFSEEYFLVPRETVLWLLGSLNSLTQEVSESTVLSYTLRLCAAHREVVESVEVSNTSSNSVQERYAFVFSAAERGTIPEQLREIGKTNHKHRSLSRDS